MHKWLVLLLGGCLGTLGRYAVSGAVQRWTGAEFPFGTLVVNVLGCLAVGFIARLAEAKLLLDPELRLFLFVGLLGAFTTFSTLIYESWQLIQGGHVGAAGVNLVGSVAAGLAALWVGSSLASTI